MHTGIKSFLIAAIATLTAVQAATVRGRVTSAGTTTGIASAKVVIQGSGADDSTLTDASGNYEFEDVASGSRTLIATKEGYERAQATVTAGSGNQTHTVNLQMTPTAARTGSIAGTVRDSSDAIDNAMVILSRRGQPVDTVRSGANGSYLFSDVAPANDYVVTASIGGYLANSANGVDAVAGDTTRANIVLSRVPPSNGSIVGKATDASTQAPVAGVTVVLRRRTASGTWTPVDTAVTANDGDYRFSGLAASTSATPYSVVASLFRYDTYTSQSIALAQSGTSTVNLPLVKQATGNLVVYVAQDTTGRPSLSGVIVTAVLESDESVQMNGKTNPAGYMDFRNSIVRAGSWSVTVSAAGFVMRTASITVRRDAGDTLRINMARATGPNSKSLSGIVRDGAGKAVAGAKVILTTSTGGYVVGIWTTATGDYSFTGIPVAVAGGTLSVTKDGYGTQSFEVSLVNDPTYLNVTFETPISVRKALPGAFPGLAVKRHAGSLLTVSMPASPWAGRLAVYDLRGGLIQSTSVSAGMQEVTVRARSGSATFLVLERGGMVEKLRVVPAP